MCHICLSKVCKKLRGKNKKQIGLKTFLFSLFQDYLLRANNKQNNYLTQFIFIILPLRIFKNGLLFLKTNLS